MSKVKTKLSRRPKFKPLPSYGHLFTWAEFVESARDGMISEYDGSGALATATQISNISVRPTQARRRARPAHPWVTHVVWFNK